MSDIAGGHDHQVDLDLAREQFATRYGQAGLDALADHAQQTGESEDDLLAEGWEPE